MSNKTIEITTSTGIVSIITASQGPQGPEGEKGDKGDRGADGVSGLMIESAFNIEPTNIIKLTPVYKNGLNQIGVASDTDINKCKVFGLVYSDSIGSNTFGEISTEGVVEASENEWLSNLNITLVPGQIYFLSGTGNISLFPDMNSKAVVRLGMALTTTRFKLQIDNPIIL